MGHSQTHQTSQYPRRESWCRDHGVSPYSQKKEHEKEYLIPDGIDVDCVVNLVDDRFIENWRVDLL